MSVEKFSENATAPVRPNPAGDGHDPRCTRSRWWATACPKCIKQAATDEA